MVCIYSLYVEESEDYLASPLVWKKYEGITILGNLSASSICFSESCLLANVEQVGRVGVILADNAMVGDCLFGTGSCLGVRFPSNY